MNTDKEAPKSNIPSLSSRQPAKTLKRKASDDEIPTAKNTRTKTDPDPALRKPATRPPPRAAKVTALRSVTSAANSAISTQTATRAATAKPGASKIVSSIPPAEKKSQKRPAWDTKGRLQDMEAQQEATREQLLKSSEAMNKMTEKLESSEAKISELESFRRSLEQNVEVKTRENVDISRKLSDLEHQLETLVINHKKEITTIDSRHAREKEELQYSIEALKRAKEDVETSLKRSQEQLLQKENEITQLKNTISTQSGTVLALEAEHRGMKISLETTENTLRACNVRIAELEDLLIRETTSVANLEAKVREDETVRRRLHNTILELKGNVRVFCRVRPPLPQEIADDRDSSASLSHITFPESDGKEIELKQSIESVSGQRSTLKSFPFSFDKVFPPQTTQSEIFVEIQQLVQSALDGYNVCIFAYGQTGSGKTYTMEGPNEADEESQGMISRAVHQIYETANALTEKGWKYVMEGQFLEIYNEQINDLLGNGDFNRKHDIKHTDGKTTVTDATTVIVDSSEKVNALLKKAGTNRAVGATQCNERSSRSHSVFTLRLQGTNEITDEVSSGCLNLIDLAGSERLSSSGSKGDRLKETQAINKSLSSLGDVICSIANGERHVPYRNSKLTYLLQNSLGGNSKTLMFVNVSPLPVHFSETICSLRFATKVNSCEIGTAKKIKPKQRGED